MDGEEAAPSGAPPPTVVVAALGPATAGGPSIYGTPTPSAAVAPGTPFTEPLPAGPAWVRGPNATGEGQWATYSVEQWQENVATVSAANASSTHFDYVQFGDSLTKHLARTAGLRIWEATFSEANGYGPTAPLGVVGNDIADLMVGAGPAPPPPRSPRQLHLSHRTRAGECFCHCALHAPA